MPGADHGHNSFPRCGADFFGQILIPFLDQNAFKHGHGFSHIRHQGLQDILLFHFFDIFLTDIIGFGKGDQQLIQQFVFFPEGHGLPGTGEGNTDFPVGQVNGRPQGIRRLDGPDHLGTRNDVELGGDPLLKRRQNEIGQQQKGFLFLDDLDDIHILPLIFHADGLVAGCAQLHTDRVRFFGLDHRSHQIGAFPGNMGGADQHDFLVFELQVMNHIMIVRFSHSVYNP